MYDSSRLTQNYPCIEMQLGINSLNLKGNSYGQLEGHFRWAKTG
jgi:hypothetical protein